VRGQVVCLRDALRSDPAFEGEGRIGLATCAHVLARLSDAPEGREIARLRE
jgi:hypothetical protein